MFSLSPLATFKGIRYSVALMILGALVAGVSGRARAQDASLAFVSPANGSQLNSLDVAVRVSANGFAPASVELYQGDYTVAPGYDLGAAARGADGFYSVTARYPKDGFYRLYAQANHGATLVRSPVITFTIDTTGPVGDPTLAITQPASGADIVTPSFTLKALASKFSPASVEVYEGDPTDGLVDVDLGPATLGEDGAWSKAITLAVGRQGTARYYVTAMNGATKVTSPAITLNFQVGATVPIPVLSTGSVILSAELIQTPEFPQATVTLTNQGTDSFTYSLDSEVTWLLFSPSTGTLAPGASVPLTVRGDPTSLPEGRAFGSLKVTARSGGGSTTKTVSVNLNASAYNPATPLPRPASQRYLLQASAGRLNSPLVAAMFVAFNYRRVDDSQPNSTVNSVTVRGSNGAALFSAGPYTLGGRRGDFYFYNSTATGAAGAYTVEFAFDDGAVVTLPVTIPDSPALPAAPSPTVLAWSDGSLTTRWDAVANAASYSVDLYQVNSGGGLTGITRSSYILPNAGTGQRQWTAPAGTLEAGKTYRAWVFAYSTYLRDLPLPPSTFVTIGQSADFILGTTAPPLTGSPPTVTQCGGDVTVTWTTSADATSQVNTGLAGLSGYSLSVSDFGPLTKQHTVVLRNIQAGTPYHFQAQSALSATGEGEWRSAEIGFTVPADAARRGDINDDGGVNVQDAILSLQFAVNLKPPTSDRQRNAADVNGDHQLNVQDSILVLQRAVGVVKDCP